jgi:hypothetical protein
MKITLPNGIIIFLREEDFQELTIGYDEISYIRPNGVKVVLKFPAVPMNLNMNEDQSIPAALKNPQLTNRASELTRAEPSGTWRNGKTRKEQAAQPTHLARNIELEKKIDDLNVFLKEELAIVKEKNETTKEIFDEYKTGVFERIDNLRKELMDISRNNSRDLHYLIDKVLEMDKSVKELPNRQLFASTLSDKQKELFPGRCHAVVLTADTFKGSKTDDSVSLFSKVLQPASVKRDLHESQVFPEPSQKQQPLPAIFQKSLKLKTDLLTSNSSWESCISEIEE